MIDSLKGHDVPRVDSTDDLLLLRVRLEVAEGHDHMISLAQEEVATLAVALKSGKLD